MITVPVPVEKLRRDLRSAERELTTKQARWFVDAYYQLQDFRIQAGGQARAANTDGEPHEMVRWLLDQFGVLEREVQVSLGRWAHESEAGRWAQSITGIGPVISAGLVVHIDILKAPTAGHIWRFAGLDPSLTWGKGEKRPYNAKLKVLCWKMGDSFVKQSGRESDVYGKVYRERKDLEVRRDVEGYNVKVAAETLQARKIEDAATRAVYESGHLPAGRLDLRARRYAVKLFLSHYHHVAYVAQFGAPPPKPYVIEHGGHTHFLSPPGWPM